MLDSYTHCVEKDKDDDRPVEPLLFDCLKKNMEKIIKIVYKNFSQRNKIVKN